MEGLHVAITGGARGIGAATAERLRRDGARVTLGDIDVTAVEATAARLGAVGLALDVTDRASFTAFLDAAEAAHGPVDVLINNAGIMPIGPPSGTGKRRASGLRYSCFVADDEGGGSVI